MAGWAPPELTKASAPASAPWAPPEVSAASVSPEEESANDEREAEVGAGEAGVSLITGMGAQAAGGLGMGGQYLINRARDIGHAAAPGLVNAPTVDPLDVARGLSSTLTYQPRTEQGQGAVGAIGEGMAAADRPIEAALDTMDPSGKLKARARDIAERTNYALAGASVAAPFLHAGAPPALPRAEPTFPSEPGGYTRADFEPKPPTAAPAAPEAAPAPEAAARVPVPGKPHIRPKAVPEPEAPATPSAAPDPAGNPAPGVHDPGFFPAPDNQDLKSAAAGPQEQAARQAAVERGAPTLTQVRDSAVTNDYADQGRDWTGKQAGDPAATAQIAAEGQALHSEAGRISGDTGGQQGTGESASTVRGRAYQDWHDSTVDALDKHIKAAYAEEDAAAKQIASPGSNLKGVLTDDSLIDNANAGAVRSSTVALAKKMGVDLTDPNAQLNGYQIEALRKHANSVYGSAPRLAQAIKNAAEGDLPPGAYVRARGLQKLKSDMFDNRDGINQLGPSKDIDPNTGKPRPENRPVKAPDVMNRIESMDPGQVQHIMSTMKNSSSVLEQLGDHAAAQSITDKALKAAQQLQSHFTERWIDEAGKGGGWNARRAHQFLRNNQETLASVMSPEQMHQIRNVTSAANVLDLDKRYKGAFAQFRTGASWLRQRIGRTLEGVATDLLPMGNTIGEMTGLSEKARNFLGGANKANAPENFTRPLGARIGGGKQRGAVGLLNKPGVVHDYDPETREHIVTSPNGETRAMQRGNDIQITNTETAMEARGGGEGALRVQKLADAAHAQGGKLLSDTSVSPHQIPIYDNLARQGYDVKLSPGASRTVGIPKYNEDGTLARANGEPVMRHGLTSDDTRPVFTVGPRLQRTASGTNPAFASQRGGPKFERQAEVEKGGGEESATVNIGLHSGTPGQPGFRQISKQEAVRALQSQGIKVGKTSVVQSDTEPTLVADMHRPMNEAETNTVAGKLGQQAIAQRHANGEGTLFGPQAKEWGGAYNPDFFRMHNGQTATEAHPVLGNLTGPERAQLRANTTQRLVDMFHSLPPTEETAAAALAGKAKKGWYRASAEAIANTFGPDGPRFAATLASMSPQTSVQMNFHNALRTFVNWDKAGRPTDPAAIKNIMQNSVLRQPGGAGTLPAWENNTIRALTAEDPSNVKLSGPKVHSFYNNLIGNVNEVTNDAWMATFNKIDPTGKGTRLNGKLNKSGPGKTPTYLAMSAKVRSAAKMLSSMTGEAWTPAEVQETVWSWAKTAFEHAEEHGEMTIPELVKHGRITDELLRSTPDFHQLFSFPEHAGFLAGSRYAQAAERVVGTAGAGAESSAASKKSASAARALQPHLEAAARRLESVRQERNAARTEEAPF